MVVVFGNIFGKNGLQVGGVKGAYNGIVGYIYIVVPVSKLVVQAVVETNERKQAYSAEHPIFIFKQ